jgi:ubiquinone/menaquinone biosynthesis C-methylase UbiE
MAPNDFLGRLRQILSDRARARLNRALYEIAYRIPAVARGGFFNGGLMPLSPELLAVPGLGGTPSQANLYHVVMLDQLAGLVWEPVRLLEIGCGAGGGLRYARAAWPRSALTGIDASASAIVAATARLKDLPGITLMQARGEALPFPDGGFDVVISIGTLTNVGAGAFLREAARVMMPGGFLSLSAGTGWSAPDYQAMLDREGRAAGLTLLRFNEITEGAMAAIEADAPAHQAMIARLPFFLRGQAREWAALPGSVRHARYLAGARRDMAAVFQRGA